MTRTSPIAHRVSRTVFGASGLLLGLGLGLLIGVNGCEEQSSTPPSAQGPGLSENPTSIPGRSAKTAKNTAQQAENRQSEAVAMANEMSGQSGSFQVAGLSFPVSTSWNKVTPSSNFISADFRIAGDGGEGRITVSQFPGQGANMIDANVQRWGAQFKDEAGQDVIAYPKKRTVAGMGVTMVSMDGVMKGGQMGGPPADAPDYALRGAIIEGPEGLVVLKFTGPKETVEAASADWETMIQGMTKTAR